MSTKQQGRSYAKSGNSIRPDEAQPPRQRQRTKHGSTAAQEGYEQYRWGKWKDGWSYRLLYTRCGRCRSCKAGTYTHGPYWFAERTNAKGKIVSRYVGKVLKRVRA